MSTNTIDLCPGADPTNPADRTAKRVAWIGRDPDNSSTTGAYFKNHLWVGGTNASNAPFQVDGSGNVFLSGTFNVGSSGACFYNGSGSYTKVWGGTLSITDSSGTSAIDMDGGPSNGIVVRGARPIYCTGHVRADLGFNVAGYDGATGTFTSANGKTITVRGGIITSIV